MRLLHTKDLEFQEFYDKQIPKYVILSHRWIGNEVTYAEFYDPKARERPEFAKIKNCCSFAENHGFEWVWIDTCCIDKKSSAELTEAINSMYAWYERAWICFAYLADVRMVENEHGNWEESRAEFRRSAWFTRGWTLQELLAPSYVLFLDRNWATIGCKTDSYLDGETNTYSIRNYSIRNLEEDIFLATGIKIKDLRHPRDACVARKFSWLSRRETTRVEDIAYCMLGLCNVNMPLLYGEGQRAFKRLQMEIIGSSDDESIFAWFSDRYYFSPKIGILAPHPEAFANSGSIVMPLHLPGKMPFSMTNKGLQYQVPWAQRRQNRKFKLHEKYVLLLDCGEEGKAGLMDHSMRVAITLKYNGMNWKRSGYDRMELSNTDLWTDVVNSRTCTYETFYLSA